MVNASLSKLDEQIAFLNVDSAITIAEFPGAAMLVSEDGRVIDSNSRSKPLRQELERLAAIGEGQGLAVSIRDAFRTSAPVITRLLIDRADGEDAGRQAFDITLIPTGHVDTSTRALLVLGVEATLQRNLTNALKSSRDLFRDLVLCSSDFAWETDRTGAFVYVGPRGAAGYAADALHGRSAFSLIPENMEGKGRIQDVFLAKSPVEEVEIWLSGADGERHCFVVSAVPIFDAGELWCGARGVGRDITQQRLQERQLAENDARSDLIRSIVDTIRRETDSQRMLEVSAEAIGVACDAKACWVLETSNGADFAISAEYHRNDPMALPDDVKAAIGGDLRSMSYEVGEGYFEAHKTHLHRQPNGAICIARDVAPCTEDFTTQIIGQIADHAAVVIAQANNLQRLTQLSCTDALTGLPNRRAFEEELTLRLAQHRRHDRQACMLYMDIDRFKQINDAGGHKAGDDVLRHFSKLLVDTARATDLVVRFGGDEFGLFLEETNEVGALQVVNRLLQRLEGVLLSDELLTYSISIGVAFWRPQDMEKMAGLISRADDALYAAKKAGRGQYAVSPAPRNCTDDLAQMMCE